MKKLLYIIYGMAVLVCLFIDLCFNNAEVLLFVNFIAIIISFAILLLLAVETIHTLCYTGLAKRKKKKEQVIKCRLKGDDELFYKTFTNTSLNYTIRDALNYALNNNYSIIEFEVL